MDGANEHFKVQEREKKVWDSIPWVLQRVGLVLKSNTHSGGRAVSGPDRRTDHEDHANVLLERTRL